MKDYYKILGVEKGASKDDIKKAFRKMAHQYHPDKTKNDPASGQKFKEASEAYAILSDDEKRKRYDMFGSEGVHAGQGGAGGFNPNDFGGFDFSGFQQGSANFEFDIGDIFGDLFGGGRRSRAQRGRDISIDITLSFEESVFGAEKDISVTKSSSCLTCRGSGAAAGSGLETCRTCNGKGQIIESRRSFIGVFNTSRVCETCHGKGQVPKEKCATCRGEGVVERTQEISVKIPPGIENGQMIRLSGMGEAVAGGGAGDLYVRVHVRPHQQFRKEGQNLVTDLSVKLTQALLGGEINLKTIDGDLLVRIPEGTTSGDVLRVRNRGVPDNRGKRGDLLVRLSVDMPKKLSKSARRAIEELRGEGL